MIYWPKKKTKTVKCIGISMQNYPEGFRISQIRHKIQLENACSKQYGSSLSIQKLCKLLLAPTSMGLPLIDRLVIQTPLPLVLCNWNSSLATSTSSLFKQCSNSLKPAGIVAIVWPLCLIIISLPSQNCGPVPGYAGCWHRDSSSLDVARIQKFSVVPLPRKNVL